MTANDISPASKPLSRAQQRRRNDIIQAALRIFDRDGFEAARIEDVAAEAEVAKGTVYLYFTNKEALFRGVVEAVVRPAIESVEKVATEANGSATERLGAQLRMIGDSYGKGEMKTILRLMIAEGPKHDALRRYYFSHIVEPGIAAIKQCLADGELSGEFRSGSADLCPQVLAGAPLLSVIWRILFDDLSPLDIDALIDDHFRTVLHGLRTPPGRRA